MVWIRDISENWAEVLIASSDELFNLHLERNGRGVLINRDRGYKLGLSREVLGGHMSGLSCGKVWEAAQRMTFQEPWGSWVRSPSSCQPCDGRSWCFHQKLQSLSVPCGGGEGVADLRWNLHPQIRGALCDPSCWGSLKFPALETHPSWFLLTASGCPEISFSGSFVTHAVLSCLQWGHIASNLKGFSDLWFLTHTHIIWLVIYQALLNLFAGKIHICSKSLT